MHPDDPGLPRALWDTFAPMVFRLLRRTLGPGQPVDDVVHQVFLRVFDDVCRGLRASRVSEDASRERIVLSAVARVACDHLRWRKLRGRFRRRRSPVENLYRAMGRLRARDQVAFAFHFIDRIDVREVAAALGESSARTDRRLVRAWNDVAARLGVSDRSPQALAS